VSFFYLSKLLFSGFIQVNFVRGQSKAVLLYTSFNATSSLRLYVADLFTAIKKPETWCPNFQYCVKNRHVLLHFSLHIVVVCLLFFEQEGYNDAYIKKTCMIEGLILYLSLFCFNFRRRQLMTAKKCNIGTERTAFNAVDVHVVLG